MEVRVLSSALPYARIATQVDAPGGGYMDLGAASYAPAIPDRASQDPPRGPPGLRGLHGLADPRAHLVAVHHRLKRDLGVEPLEERLSRRRDVA